MSSDALLSRLAEAERRLFDHASTPSPSGLTDPDPGSDERWEAGQVWAHLAEFPAYWLEQAEHVLAARGGGTQEPIPFGRTKADPARIAAIERARRERPVILLRTVREGILSARRFLIGADSDALAARGLHPTLGEMPVERIVEHFVVEHLEEHADQLDGLAGRS